MDVSEDLKTLLTIIRHREVLVDGLEQLRNELGKRARFHDRSKLELGQFEGFVEINRVARDHPYGSPEYKESLRRASAESGCIAKHNAAERHHPEHFVHPGGGMTFIDIIEMVYDWVAAAATYAPEGQKVVVVKLWIQHERFRKVLTTEQWWLVAQVADFIEDHSDVVTFERMRPPESPPKSPPRGE